MGPATNPWDRYIDKNWTHAFAKFWKYKLVVRIRPAHLRIYLKDEKLLLEIISYRNETKKHYTRLLNSHIRVLNYTIPYKNQKVPCMSRSESGLEKTIKKKKSSPLKLSQVWKIGWPIHRTHQRKKFWIRIDRPEQTKN